jgi:hypothetical protein
MGLGAMHNHGMRHHFRHRFAGLYNAYPYNYDACWEPYRLHRHRRWVCS